MIRKGATLWHRYMAGVPLTAAAGEQQGQVACTNGHTYRVVDLYRRSISRDPVIGIRPALGPVGASGPCALAPAPEVHLCRCKHYSDRHMAGVGECFDCRCNGYEKVAAAMTAQHGDTIEFDPDTMTWMSGIVDLMA